MRDTGRRYLFLVLALLGAGLAHGIPAAAEGGALDAMLARLYGGDGARQLWSEPGRSAALRTVLGRAGEEGLEPADYALTPGASDRDHSRALGRYLQDLRAGREAPRRADPELFLSPPRSDLAALVLAASTAPDLTQYLAALVPASPGYRALRTELARYRALAASGGWAPVPPGETLRAGSIGPRVERLRARLQRTGELPAAVSEAKAQAALAAPVSVFDPPLEAAVRRFQARHGLEVDGIAGAETQAALNVSARERVTQLIVNLERWRWLPDDLGQRHVVVNIAGFELLAVEQGRTVLQMRVVVGRPYRRTPVFSDQIRFIELNPTWSVPLSIIENDIIPGAIRDPEYLTREGFQVFDNVEGGQAEPDLVDWHVAPAGRYRFVQAPGPRNALGQLKIMFPNAHDVYLHDTPSKGLFSKRMRAFSSGCIRVQQPLELAAWLLAEPRWGVAQLAAQIALGRTVTVPLKQRVPVHILYATAWVDSTGQLQFRPDIYARDALIANALRP